MIVTEDFELDTKAPEIHTSDRLKLSTHAANAARAAITELNQLRMLTQAKEAEIRRLMELFISEAGIDHEQFTAEGIETTKGETYLRLKPVGELVPPQGE